MENINAGVFSNYNFGIYWNDLFLMALLKHVSSKPRNFFVNNMERFVWSSFLKAFWSLEIKVHHFHWLIRAPVP